MGAVRPANEHKRERVDAAALVRFLEEHVVHELRVVRRGRRRLIPVDEPERWLEQSAVRAALGQAEDSHSLGGRKTWSDGPGSADQR